MCACQMHVERVYGMKASYSVKKLLHCLDDDLSHQKRQNPPIIWWVLE